MELKPRHKQTNLGTLASEWDSPSLGDLFAFKNGLNKAKRFFGYGTPIVNYMDVYERRGLVASDLKGRVDLSREELQAFDVRKGDVFFTRTSETVAEVGISSVMLGEPKDTVFSGFVLRARPKDNSLDDHFKKYCFSTYYVRRQITSQSTETTRALTNGRHLSRVQILRPPLREQRAIADVLSDVDELLSALDRLIAKKRDIKQAAMQQLLTGQTRLPGFSGKWGVKRLEHAGSCLRGVSYRGEMDLSSHDTAYTKRLLRANNVQDAVVVTHDIQFVNAARVASQQTHRADDILVCLANGSRALVGKAALFALDDGFDYTFGAFMGCFRTDLAAANPRFVFCLFQTSEYRNYISNLLAGSSINNLRPRSVESLEFAFPTVPEQTAIAAVLSDMDAELFALEQRRAKTRALKQAMLQELLTGRTRLVTSEAMNA